MPARFRAIGPEDSGRVAKAMKQARDRKGWTLVRLSQEMAVHGDRMSPSTLAHIERGIQGEGRLVTMDEVVALIRALGNEFRRAVITILTEES